VLTADQQPGSPAKYDLDGRMLAPATIPCTLPEVFSCVSDGLRIWLDDGKIGGVIRQVTNERIEVEITHSRPKGLKLMADKGINLPDSDLDLPALTQKDIHDLTFVAQHADIVGYSFVRTVDDIDDLLERLAPFEHRPLGIMLKIETRGAFEQLPNLLLTAMRRPSVGVMIARGDLAVECGFERLAEVQEEILWICEAAHVPVVWATQVLESLAKFGMPSRAEITDAAMGVRAECVMLNKGPYIVETLRALDDILRRMEAHQSKKTSMLRPLGLAKSFLGPSFAR
jgi:pyruvate kinase